MFIAEMITELDIRTLIEILFLFNLTMAFVSLYALKSSPYDKKVVIKIALAKFLQAFMWFLIFYSGSLPQWLSVNVANTFGFIGFYFEAEVLIDLAFIRTKSITFIQSTILILFIVLINAFSLLGFSIAMRIVLSSLSICVLFFVPLWKYLFSPGKDSLKRLIGSFLFIFVFFNLLRVGGALLNPFMGIFESSIIQAGVFLSNALILLTNGIGILLIAVEDSRKVMQKNSERYRIMSDFAYNWEYWMDPHGNFVYMSPSCEEITGYSSRDFELISGLLEKIILPDQKTKEVESHFAGHQATADTGSGEIQFPIRTAGGEIRWIGHVCRSVFDDHGNHLGRRASNRDITHIKKLEFDLQNEVSLKEDAISRLQVLSDDLDRENRQLAITAMTDSLTGIANREYFDKRIEEEIVLADRYDSMPSLIFFDLDHFKKVNDSYGHDAGDLVLKNISETVANLVRKSDVFARWGGEEFIILMPRTGLVGAVVAAEKIRIAISEIQHPEVGKVTISVGVAERIPSEYHLSWFKRVDEVLYKAKEEGRNCTQVYSHTEAHESSQKYIAWDNEWLCGNELIDSQHRALLDAGNLLVISSFDSEIPYNILLKRVNDFIGLMAKHFSDEETILEAAGYPLLEEHRLIHNQLLVETKKLKQVFKKREESPAKLFHFLIDEIVSGHLIKEDFKYFLYIQSDLKNPG